MNEIKRIIIFSYTGHCLYFLDLATSHIFPFLKSGISKQNKKNKHLLYSLQKFKMFILSICQFFLHDL